jgi:lipoprotein-releasing system permease protein
MRFELLLARRYLRSPGKGLAKITSRLAVVGIALGVGALIFALALSRGFREEVQEKLLANTAHINVSRADGDGIANWREIKTDISKIDGVKNVAAAAYESSLLISTQGSFYTVLRGREEIQPVNKGDCIAATLGSELMSKAGLSLGETVDVVFGINNESKPNKVCLAIAGPFTTGLYEYDSTWVNVSLEDLDRITGSGPSAIEVMVNNIYSSKTVAESIKEKLGGEFKVIDWQEANRPFFAAMNFERRIVLIIISLVILLSALNITFTLALGVTQRRQDIAVLRTAGAKASKIVNVFLLEGLLLGAIGIFSGVILGLAACFLSNHFNLISLPPEVYSLNKITLLPDVTEILTVIFAAFLLCLLATAYPAVSASRVKPWENLRQ